MKRRTSLIAKTASALIVVLVLSFVLKAQNGRQLYLVTGYTTRNGPQKVARVNDKLYQAEIGQSAIQNPIQIVRNQNVQLAHWAFLANK